MINLTLEHSQRFFAYLSLFTFMMVLLVTGNNYLLMFVGWEGWCPIWKFISNCFLLKDIIHLYYNILSNLIFITDTFSQKGFKFYQSDLYYFYMISPGCVVSLIVGSLSNAFFEKRKNGLIRILFIKCSNNVEYLTWFHKIFVKTGYCSDNKPKLYKIIEGNKTLFVYSFTTYSFSGYTWLYNMFYCTKFGLVIKIIPRNLDKYLTPLALATWFLTSKAFDGKKAKYSKMFYFKK